MPNDNNAIYVDSDNRFADVTHYDEAQHLANVEQMRENLAASNLAVESIFNGDPGASNNVPSYPMSRLSSLAAIYTPEQREALLDQAYDRHHREQRAIQHREDQLRREMAQNGQLGYYEEMARNMMSAAEHDGISTEDFRQRMLRTTRLPEESAFDFQSRVMAEMRDERTNVGMLRPGELPIVQGVVGSQRATQAEGRVQRWIAATDNIGDARWVVPQMDSMMEGYPLGEQVRQVNSVPLTMRVRTASDAYASQYRIYSQVAMSSNPPEAIQQTNLLPREVEAAVANNHLTTYRECTHDQIKIRELTFGWMIADSDEDVVAHSQANYHTLEWAFRELAIEFAATERNAVGYPPFTFRFYYDELNQLFMEDDHLYRLYVRVKKALSSMPNVSSKTRRRDDA